MKTCFRWCLVLFLPPILVGALWFGPLTSSDSRALGAAVSEIDRRLSRDGETLALALNIVEVDGVPKELAGKSVEISLCLPDRLRVATEIDGHSYRLGRDGGKLWMEVPHLDLAIEGSEETPRFASDPESVDSVKLPDWEQPLSGWQRALLPAAFRVEPVAGEPNRLRCRPRVAVARRAGLPEDLVIHFERSAEGHLSGVEAETGGTRLRLELKSMAWVTARESEELPWGIVEVEKDKVDRVALSHLVRFAEVGLGNLNAKIPTLPPSDGSREVLASHGDGRLERIDGTLVLFLEGTPEEMGEQHGVLMREEVRNLVDRIVYGVGVGSSFGKGRWFFGEIEEAQGRLEPFTDERHLREMDALAAAVGLHPQEIRLANFFPELFHCSGFALHGTATVDGRMYHGRILDYLRGLGLEQNALVMVVKPDRGNAWVNVGYAGFVGTVTAMNEKQIAIGEMGGRGEGDWDGKPMAQLMREVMERADTIDEAVEIMRTGPRTCEYYYVISDAKSGRAVGIKATPEIFETVWSGESHPQLPRPVVDTVLLSSGDRYETLVNRVEEGFGQFDAESAIALMERPVCMNSNIQSVLFAPDTLDFWVANADSENVASHTRYALYNLRELLEEDESGRSLTLSSNEAEGD